MEKPEVLRWVTKSPLTLVADIQTALMSRFENALMNIEEIEDKDRQANAAKYLRREVQLIKDLIEDISDAVLETLKELVEKQ